MNDKIEPKADDGDTGKPKDTVKPADAPKEAPKEATEQGGPQGPEPTRFGDWERKGRCVDF